MIPRSVPASCEHGHPGTTCPTCYPRAGSGATRTPEQRAAIRQAIADGRAALKLNEGDPR